MTMPDLTAFEADAAATPVLAEIHRAKWRKARDAAKDLCRKDKARYLPLLVAANAGLACEMLDRGLDEDAAAVISYLKTIAPPGVAAGLETKQIESRATTVIKRGGTGQHEALWQALDRAASLLDEGGEPSPGALRAADFLVTVTSPPPDPGRPVAVELLAVREAMEATGAGQWDLAREKLQGLPRRSLFQHWRLFLRGVRHAHHWETAEAARCFDGLPAASATARAAALYREILGLPATTDQVPAEAAVPFLAAIAGASPAWSAPLTEAARHWKRGKLEKAYEALANPLRQHFPTDEPGFAAVLTDLMMAGSAGRCSLPFSTRLEFVDSLSRRSCDGRFRSDREAVFALRFILHEDGRVLDGSLHESYGSELAAAWNRLRGRDPLRESALWSLCASHLEIAADDGAWGNPAPGDTADLQRFLERAAQLDPDHPGPALLLAGFFQSCGDLRKYNTQLTALTKRFPEHKAVLLLGAAESARRKSWPKALSTLRRIREIDPFDETALQLLITTLSQQAVALTKKKQPVPDSLWQEMDPLLLDASLPAKGNAMPPIARLRWTALTLRSQLEGGDRNAEAVRAAPSPWAHLHLAIVLKQRYVLSWEGDWPGVPPVWRDLVWMLHLANWDHASRTIYWVEMDQLAHIMEQCLIRLDAAGHVTQDPDDLLVVVKLLQDRLDRRSHGPYSSDAAYFKLRHILAAAARQKNSSYQIRIASILLPECTLPAAACLAAFEAAVREARAAGDTRTLDLALTVLELLRNASASELPPDHGEPGGFDEGPPVAPACGPQPVEELPPASSPSGLFDSMALTEGQGLNILGLIGSMHKLFPRSVFQDAKKKILAGGFDKQRWRMLESAALIMACDLSLQEAAQTIEAAKLNPLFGPHGAFPFPFPPPDQPPSPSNPAQPELF